ncbi:protein translocase subunit SecF [Paenibacillus urinalis]|uniref:Protein-export membrane protein SecF n=2 Tax=Paenibacillus TaxID=44249 RepID=A0AAX3MX00_9BACL|nr:MULTISPECIES: protein translocase subunit SecF [Paenibacillus]OMC69233.1 protein-export membrane protein SecF [Paenibacillus sp. FSL H7-0326]WDH81782.1 protein translocase subunit SecF [Paenibacillus urinalis]WDH97832.1 protein translocase subunit SecF [Paenibacillus urinalis]WDI01508.1 protein translocase subunit SecF [Paenibacillus urinalis]SDX00874.1 protein translocase subunit secF [Paenibacillus sp. PDC88]
MRFNWEFDYIKISKYFYTFSIVITLLGILSLAVFGLNYGVDFRSGSNVDVTASKTITTEEIEPVLEELGLADDEPAISAGTSQVNIRFSSVLNEEQEANLKSAFNEQIDPEASFEVNTVDPEMAKELGRNAIYAVLIASLGILIYVTIRFEWRFAVAAIVALLHDAFVVISIFSLFRWEVDLTFITAVLTIVGFSINDTIVVFDRIRENLRFAKTKTSKDVNEVVNRSIAQTMTRSLNTTITVFIASLFLFLLGGESIRMFSLAMVIGLVFGAYSSIFIASPLWAILKNKQKPKTNNPAKSAN